MLLTICEGIGWRRVDSVGAATIVDTPRRPPEPKFRVRVEGPRHFKVLQPGE